MVDLINGLFECFGGVLITLSIIRLYKDKQTKGISIWPMLFFNAWGFWNLIFYPYVGAWLSFLGSICVTTANTVWIIQVFYYMRKNHVL